MRRSRLWIFFIIMMQLNITNLSSNKLSCAMEHARYTEVNKPLLTRKALSKVA